MIVSLKKKNQTSNVYVVIHCFSKNTSCPTKGIKKSKTFYLLYLWYMMHVINMHLKQELFIPSYQKQHLISN